MRVRAVLAALLATLLSGAPVASAQDVEQGAFCGSGRKGDTMVCPTWKGLSGGGGGSTTNTGGSTEPPGEWRWEAWPRIIRQPDGSLCIGPVYQRVPASDPPVDWDWDTGIVSPWGGPIFPCPPAERTAREAAWAYAVESWEEVPLPAPRPHMAPGWAITGKWIYLETRGQLSFTHTSTTPVGPLEIRATGSYVVDWGDGEVSFPYHQEGKPWPDGEIRHIYTHSGSYDVVVTERWTATWSIGSFSGTLSELRTTGRIDDLPAREIQAVVIASPR